MPLVVFACVHVCTTNELFVLQFSLFLLSVSPCLRSQTEQDSSGSLTELGCRSFVSRTTQHTGGVYRNMLSFYWIIKHGTCPTMSCLPLQTAPREFKHTTIEGKKTFTKCQKLQDMVLANTSHASRGLAAGFCIDWRLFGDRTSYAS